ncbi:MAG: aldehyde dehydrogenase family protein, partial [Phycisphaerae bacterium]|nr:aldehyde dehydrogenase family protein [Phycisphaerae bacterium]
GRIIALELGGNNASVVMPDADLHLAAVECARAAFATTGQRCTCTRRILVHEDVSKPLVDRLCEIATGLVVGDPRGEVFMGPLIRAEARDAALRAQQTWISRGATPLLESRPINDPFEGHYISPGILRVPRFELDESACGGDIELFAPIVRVATVKSLDEAITQCNMTRFGLAASIFTQHAASIDRFLAEARAGCINVNTGTAGASGKLPFGGLGLSGNHRPAGAFALDYCAYPVASLIESGADAPLSPGMRLHDSNTR